MPVSRYSIKGPQAVQMNQEKMRCATYKPVVERSDTTGTPTIIIHPGWVAASHVTNLGAAIGCDPSGVGRRVRASPVVSLAKLAQTSHLGFRSAPFGSAAFSLRLLRLLRLFAAHFLPIALDPTAAPPHLNSR